MDSAQIAPRFERTADGTWICREPVTVHTHHGPVVVKPGMRFRYGNKVDDMDLAEMLERLGAQHGS